MSVKANRVTAMIIQELVLTIFVLMKRSIASIFFSFLTVVVVGQDISRHEADSLLGTLSRAGVDASHINSLLTLALFEIHKPGELKIDLDSAADFINQAKQINAKLGSTEADGY